MSGFDENAFRGPKWYREQRGTRIAALEAENARLKAIIQRYMNTYPAFRMKPIGAPGSIARIEQEKLMELEEIAVAALANKDESHE